MSECNKKKQKNPKSLGYLTEEKSQKIMEVAFLSKLCCVTLNELLLILGTSLSRIKNASVWMPTVQAVRGLLC